MIAWYISLEMFCLGTVAWKLLTGSFRLGAFAWDISLGIFYLVYLSLWIFRLVASPWDLSIGNSCLGAFTSHLSLGNFRWLGWLEDSTSSISHPLLRNGVRTLLGKPSQGEQKQKNKTREHIAAISVPFVLRGILLMIMVRKATNKPSFRRWFIANTKIWLYFDRFCSFYGVQFIFRQSGQESAFKILAHAFSDRC